MMVPGDLVERVLEACTWAGEGAYVHAPPALLE